MKLRTQILLLVLPLWVLSLVTFEWLSSRSALQTTQERVEQDLQNLATFAKEQINSLFESASVDLKMFASVDLFKQYLDYEMYGLKDEANLRHDEIKRLFQTLINARSSYARISFNGENGAPIIAVPSGAAVEDVGTFRPNQFGVQISDVFSVGDNKSAVRMKLDLNTAFKGASLTLDVLIQRTLEPLHHYQLISSSRFFISDEFGKLIYSTGTSDESEGKNRRFEQSIPELKWDVTLVTDPSYLASMSKEIRKKSLWILLAILGMIFVLSYSLSWTFSRPIERLSSAIAQLNTDEPGLQRRIKFSDQFKATGKEISRITLALDGMLDRLGESYLRITRLQKDKTIAEIARQVSHDIRSPLAALNMMSDALTELPEEKRLILKSAAQRVNDIANNLLNESERLIGRERTLLGSQATLLTPVLSSLMTEKRIQYQLRDGIQIDFHPHKSAFHLFSNVELAQFKTIISNIVNNAVESISLPEGKVSVGISEKGNFAEIIIEDSGIGMSKETLDQIGAKGVSIGKVGGAGLGLYHAKQRVDHWGGKIEIESLLGKGTRVQILLPKCASPSWFRATLSIPEKGTVVILDDDRSIHGVWRERLAHRSLNVINFYTLDALEKWHREQKSFGDTLFLCDYELTGETRSGLDVIEELGIQSHSALVTSHYNELDIQNRCAKLSIPLIPKEMAATIEVVG